MMVGDGHDVGPARARSLPPGANRVSAPESALGLPVGTATFLLTDVAGSTRLWNHEDDAAMRAAIVRHYEILHEAVERNRGVRPLEQGEGDSIVAAFERPSDALHAASDALVKLAAEPWPTSEPLQVRMAVHTGEAQLRDDANYAGLAIIRTARLRALAHGGQVLVSGATRGLVVDESVDRFAFRSLGEHRLRDLDRPENVWQLLVDGVAADFESLQTTEAVPNSLPTTLSSFIGRTNEIASLGRLVATDRLVTVIGSGGAGKTRLAREVGAAALDEFPAGVWWAELAAVDADGVESSVRAAFGISEGATSALEESVHRLLGGRQCLLIVDNCEHVADTVRPLVDRLLSRDPSLHVLATSRVMLDVPGETGWRIPPLGVPDTASGVSLESAARFEAVSLFCERAQRARPTFALSDDNAAVVAEICHRLDGIPLAIELAAARCRLLDPTQILAGLDNAFRILSGGSKALMARQQTLEASISWSYDLLSPAERTLLCRLSVFVDGWTLDAAVAICCDLDDTSEPGPLDPLGVFDAMDRLVDHSLVHTADTATGVRFGMLETVRQYATRLLGVARPGIRLRHSQYYVAWASSLDEDLVVRGEPDLADTVTAERANIVAATRYAISEGDATAACHALGMLRLIIERSGWASMGSRILAQTDELLGAVSPADEWLVHAIRRSVLAQRSDPLNELTTLDAMRGAAEAADQQVGVLTARMQTVVMLSLTGAHVFEELRQIGDDLETRDPTYAEITRWAAAAVAAYTGNLRFYDSFRSLVRGGSARSMSAAALDAADGVAAFFRGDPLAAIASLSAATSAGCLNVSMTNIAEGILSAATADVGRTPDLDVELRLRRASQVDDNIPGGFVADNMSIYRHLLAGDTAAADVVNAGVVRGWEAFGIAGGVFQLNYLLVAAGLGQPAKMPRGDVAPIVAAETMRTVAEQLLRAGDPSGALDAAHRALDVEVQEGLIRGMLHSLECVARISTASGHHAEAARIFGACDEFRSQRTLFALPCLQHLIDQALGTLRTELGIDAFDRAWADGSTLTLEAAAADAGERRRDPPS